MTTIASSVSCSLPTAAGTPVGTVPMGPCIAQWVRLLSLFFLMVASIPAEAHADVTCAIDMGSNSFRRIVASFENGRYETFFAKADRAEGAAMAFRSQLLQQASMAPFMKGMKRLVGVEFGEMAAGLFPPAPLEGRVLTLAQLKQTLQEITAMSPAAFHELKTRKDIDRALPRLIAAATVTEASGYSEILLTERELGAGLIIEAGITAR